jgi:hypothetical protein
MEDQDILIAKMEANAKKVLDELAKADAEVSIMVKAEEEKIKKVIEEQNALTEKLIKETKEAIDKLAKEIEDKKDKPKDEVAKKDASKISEAELVVYGKTIGADVDMKYSKAKNSENVKLKQ